MPQVVHVQSDATADDLVQHLIDKCHTYTGHNYAGHTYIGHSSSSISSVSAPLVLSLGRRLQCTTYHV